MAENEVKAPGVDLAMFEEITSGKIELTTPIVDGEKEYKELYYDFNKLTGWELAAAMDDGARGRNSSQQSGTTDQQHLCVFAAAAAKATGGLDKKDIRERIGAKDAIVGINLATLFFRYALLAGSMRMSKE